MNDDIKLNELKEGDIIDVGGYEFEVIHFPGHTKGSIGLLDKKSGILISGDIVNSVGPIYMFGPERNLELYIEGLKKLLTYSDYIKTILPSHGGSPLSKEYIEYCLEDAESLYKGELTGEDCPELPCKLYKGKYTSLYSDID